MIHHVAGLYGHQSGICNMLINTAFSLAAALFVFVILPAGDFIIGEEPPEAVGLGNHCVVRALQHHQMCKIP